MWDDDDFVNNWVWVTLQGRGYLKEVIQLVLVRRFVRLKFFANVAA